MIDLVGYNHAQEHADHVFGAQYDDIRERYHAERLDMEMYDASEQEHDEYMWKVKQAGFGDDWEEYEAYWAHVLKTAEEEHYNG